MSRFIVARRPVAERAKSGWVGTKNRAIPTNKNPNYRYTPRQSVIAEKRCVARSMTLKKAWPNTVSAPNPKLAKSLILAGCSQ